MTTWSSIRIQETLVKQFHHQTSLLDQGSNSWVLAIALGGQQHRKGFASGQEDTSASDLMIGGIVILITIKHSFSNLYSSPVGIWTKLEILKANPIMNNKFCPVIFLLIVLLLLEDDDDILNVL